MSVCLLVCLYAISSETVRVNATDLSRNLLQTQEKVDINFLPEKNCSLPYCRLSMQLTNRIAAYENIELIGSEGGQRPSERSSMIINMFDRSVTIIRLLQVAYMTDQTNHIFYLQIPRSLYIRIDTYGRRALLQYCLLFRKIHFIKLS